MITIVENGHGLVTSNPGRGSMHLTLEVML